MGLLFLGLPTMIRSDCGTEKCSLAACHMMLRHNNDEFSGERSYRYGSSTTNTVNIVYINLCTLNLMVTYLED